MRLIPLTICTLLCWISFIHQASAQTRSMPTSATSASRNFVVRGGKQHENMIVANWADKTLERLQKVMGEPVVFSRNHPFIITLKEAPQKTLPRVIKRQKWQAQQVRQELMVIRYKGADQEDILEGLTTLLLNRYLFKRQNPQERKKRPGHTPDWFGIGMAQSLFPETRQRNRTLVQQAWKNNSLENLNKLLNAEYLPPGRRTLKSMAGIFIEFLSKRENGKQIFEKLFQAWSDREIITLEQMANLLFLTGETRRLLMEWDLWIVHYDHVASDLKVYKDQLVVKLKNMDPVHLEKEGIPFDDNAPPIIAFEELIEYHNEPWYAPLVGKLAWKIRVLRFESRKEKFNQIADAYIEYFTLLRQINKKKKGLFSGRPSPRVARKKLKTAQEMLEKYLRQNERRENYLNTFEPSPKKKKKTDMNVDRKKFLDLFDLKQ